MDEDFARRIEKRRAIAREIETRCRERQDIAFKAQERLQSMFKGVSSAVPVYVFKSRIKNPLSITLKVIRKREQDPARDSPYTPDDVTDVLGCRYVTLFQSEIPAVVEELLKAVDAFNDSSADTIELREAIIYSNRPENDPLSIVKEVQSVLGSSRSGCARPAAISTPKSRESAYSSVHLIFAIPVILTSVSLLTDTSEIATFEVQIRDIFEEGWGEIQHGLLYSSKDEIESLPLDSETQWQLHLNALKTFVDGCSQHASIIRRNSEFMRQRPAPSLNTKSATSRPDDKTAILDLLKTDTAAEIVEEISAAYNLIIDAQSDADDGGANYRAGALRLRGVIDSLTSAKLARVVRHADRPIEYFLRIEYANCLSFSGDPRAVEQAVRLYEELAAQFPQDATVRLRLARAELNAHPSTDEQLQRVQELTEECIRLIPQDKPTGPTHWINMAVMIQLSYVLGQRAEIRLPSDERRNAFFREAAAAADGIWVRWSELAPDLQADSIYRFYAHKGVSNALFYKSMVIFSLNVEPSSEIVQDLRANIDRIILLDIRSYREYYKTVDNMMHAYQAIGEHEKAQDLARENVTIFRDRASARAGGRRLSHLTIKNYLTEDERPNYENAIALLAEASSAGPHAGAT